MDYLIYLVCGVQGSNGLVFCGFQMDPRDCLDLPSLQNPSEEYCDKLLTFQTFQTFQTVVLFFFFKKKKTRERERER